MVLVVKTPVSETVTKKGPVKVTLNAKLVPTTSPVTGSKMIRKVGTTLRKTAPVKKLKLLPFGKNIPQL